MSDFKPKIILYLLNEKDAKRMEKKARIDYPNKKILKNKTLYSFTS